MWPRPHPARDALYIHQLALDQWSLYVWLKQRREDVLKMFSINEESVSSLCFYLLLENRWITAAQGYFIMCAEWSHNQSLITPGSCQHGDHEAPVWDWQLLCSGIRESSTLGGLGCFVMQIIESKLKKKLHIWFSGWGFLTCKWIHGCSCSVTEIICYSDNCLTKRNCDIWQVHFNCCSFISSSQNVNVKSLLFAVLVYGKVHYLFNCWSIYKSRGECQHWYQGVKQSHSDKSADIRAEKIPRVIQIIQFHTAYWLFLLQNYACSIQRAPGAK